MPLNYSKWDNVELSDDSDIEGHPNVDKKSLIRWKQRDIHEKREVRNARIAQLQADIACNTVLLPKLRAIAEDLAAASDVPARFSATVQRLQTAPSPDAPPVPGAQTYDAMLNALLLRVKADTSVTGDLLGATLLAGVNEHVVKLGEEIPRQQKELDKEMKEKAKKITTEDIHEGFESKYVPAKPEPAPIPGLPIPSSSKSKTTSTKTEFEVLNPKAAAAPAPSAPAAASAAATEEDDDDEPSGPLPKLTPSLEEFSKIPYGAFERSYQFIQQHRDVVVAGASDALLVAAFDAQSNGSARYAKQCVHQSCLLQYCEKLGGDGVRVFFMKMIKGDPRAVGVFLQDVDQTYEHLVKRVAVAAEETAAAGGEQIQLVAEDPGTTISFNVPDGPPPEDLRLEGPGTEGLDVEEVRKHLQMRWDLFEGFSEALKAALRKNDLDAVNAVLGKMSVEEAEGVVSSLDVGGILSFAQGGIRDETGLGKDDDDEEEDAKEVE